MPIAALNLIRKALNFPAGVTTSSYASTVHEKRPAREELFPVHRHVPYATPDFPTWSGHASFGGGSNSWKVRSTWTLAMLRSFVSSMTRVGDAANTYRSPSTPMGALASVPRDPLAPADMGGTFDPGGVSAPVSEVESNTAMTTSHGETCRRRDTTLASMRLRRASSAPRPSPASDLH